MRQFAAKLLFQWRPVRGGVSRQRRVCEERIILLSAATEASALKKAKKFGQSQRSDHPAFGRREGHVYFEFVGVLALLETPTEGEVWYELTEMLRPMERRDQILPTEEELLTEGKRKRVSRKLSTW